MSFGGIPLSVFSITWKKLYMLWKMNFHIFSPVPCGFTISYVRKEAVYLNDRAWKFEQRRYWKMFWPRRLFFTSGWNFVSSIGLATTADDRVDFVMILAIPLPPPPSVPDKRLLDVISSSKSQKKLRSPTKKCQRRIVIKRVHIIRLAIIKIRTFAFHVSGIYFNERGQSFLVTLTIRYARGVILRRVKEAGP